MIGKTISHHRILEEIGRGGMGVVYKAEDTKLQRTVALKFLPPDVAGDAEVREHFLNEARAASALNHPNICIIYAVEEGEQPFIDIEFVEGRELREIIAANFTKPLRFSKVMNYATQIAQGLHAAHKKNIIHRDIIPANIMVTLIAFTYYFFKSVDETFMTEKSIAVLAFADMSPEKDQEYFCDGMAEELINALAYVGIADNFIVGGFYDLLPPKTVFSQARMLKPGMC